MVVIYFYDLATICFFIFLKNLKLELAQQPFYWKLFYKNVKIFIPYLHAVSLMFYLIGPQGVTSTV